MEEHVLGITKLVNRLLGPLVLSLLNALHITPDHPELPIPQHVVMGLVVLVIGTLVALFLRSRLSVEKPGASQQIAEMFLTITLRSTSRLSAQFRFSFSSATCSELFPSLPRRPETSAFPWLAPSSLFSIL